MCFNFPLRFSEWAAQFYLHSSRFFLSWKHVNWFSFTENRLNLKSPLGDLDTVRLIVVHSNQGMLKRYHDFPLIRWLPIYAVVSIAEIIEAIKKDGSSLPADYRFTTWRPLLSCCSAMLKFAFQVITNQRVIDTFVIIIHPRFRYYMRLCNWRLTISRLLCWSPGKSDEIVGFLVTLAVELCFCIETLRSALTNRCWKTLIIRYTYYLYWVPYFNFSYGKQLPKIERDIYCQTVPIVHVVTRVLPLPCVSNPIGRTYNRDLMVPSL